MAKSTDDYGAKVNEWVSVVRRARFGAKRQTFKLVALTIASYANPDGTKIYPGVARLAVQCEVSYATARRALAWLRDAGLIEVMKPGNARRGESDEYRLIFHPDLPERIDLLNPDDERAAIESENQRNTAAGRKRQLLALTQMSANEPEDNPLLALTQVSANNGYQRSSGPFISAHPDERPPSIYTHPESATHPPSTDPQIQSSTQPQTARVKSTNDDLGIGDVDFESERRRQMAALETRMRQEKTA